LRFVRKRKTGVVLERITYLGCGTSGQRIVLQSKYPFVENARRLIEKKYGTSVTI
jgi:hypothetical protein